MRWLGLKFRSDVGGTVPGVRFYKGTAWVDVVFVPASGMVP